MDTKRVVSRSLSLLGSPPPNDNDDHHHPHALGFIRNDSGKKRKSAHCQLETTTTNIYGTHVPLLRFDVCGVDEITRRV